MLHRVVLVKTGVSEELSASFIRLTRIGELGTTLAVTSNRRTMSLQRASVVTRAKRRNIPEDAILLFMPLETLRLHHNNHSNSFLFSYDSYET
jgi:hypothetical protein